MLDIVVVEDIAHFEELMSDGIPMARVPDAPLPPAPRTHVRIRRGHYVLLLLGVAFMPSVWMWPQRATEAWALLERLF